ncbi:hypothetical protein [Phyllobacterium salinisoli]|nr:hypothetical protein [Phyllobacterium salinisoli]
MLMIGAILLGPALPALGTKSGERNDDRAYGEPGDPATRKGCDAGQR